MIETHVPGRPGSIRAAAEWLSPALRDGLNAFADFCKNQRVGYSAWHGEAGDAYHGVLERLRRAANEQPRTTADAAEKLRAYAGQLERMQNRFADLRDEATAGGLVVVGTVIEPPAAAVPPPALGPNATGAQMARADALQEAYDQQLRKVELYNEIAHAVGAAWDKLETWITDNLIAFEAELDPLPLSTVVLGSMSTVNSAAFDMIMELTHATHQDNITILREHAETLRREAGSTPSPLDSENRAVRQAATAADPDALRRTASRLESAAGWWRRSPTRYFPAVGNALSLGLAGQEIASGASPSSVVVREAGAIVGAIAAGAVTAAALTALSVTAPVWGTAIVVVGGAVAVGAGAQWAYERFVPQDVRESIDAGIEDAWDATTDFAQDAWDATTDFAQDAWEATKDFAKDTTARLNPGLTGTPHG